MDIEDIDCGILDATMTKQMRDIVWQCIQDVYGDKLRQCDSSEEWDPNGSPPTFIAHHYDYYARSGTRVSNITSNIVFSI